MTNNRYIACYEHGKPALFKTIAEIAEHFGIRGEYATELVKSWDKCLVLPGGSRCWLDFLALPCPSLEKEGKPGRPGHGYIDFFTDGRNSVFGSMRDAISGLRLSSYTIKGLVESGREHEPEDADGAPFFLDELFTGGDE